MASWALAEAAGGEGLRGRERAPWWGQAFAEAAARASWRDLAFAEPAGAVEPGAEEPGAGHRGETGGFRSPRARGGATVGGASRRELAFAEPAAGGRSRGETAREGAGTRWS
ncbi:molybdopterin molybdenumtransferase [Streptomyces lydicamycinicus]|uniref:Molybdopterin molybdenumtransferase n=1 Tax=Streptomyces lydicamycinicus TaxID=1546107 RepID=A0A0P4R117_9ACTN|nr:molybdopterin molybdenumtransferase [Streptomyces lydicamycinicus]